MFRRLLDRYIQDPILFAVGVFVVFYWFGAIRHQLKPYYEALVQYTGGGFPAIVELYESAILAIQLLFQ
ncbi:hypothetical protein ACPV5U_08495 [Vibrio mediterranei]